MKVEVPVADLAFWQQLAGDACDHSYLAQYHQPLQQVGRRLRGALERHGARLNASSQWELLAYRPADRDRLRSRRLTVKLPRSEVAASLAAVDEITAIAGNLTKSFSPAVQDFLASVRPLKTVFEDSLARQ